MAEGLNGTAPAERLITFDAMRGIAAVCVMITHVNVAGMPHWVDSGYLAVDFFFLLSGFVIARTYGDRLGAGLGLGRFAMMRTVRLYPLYFIGFVLGLAKCIGQIVFQRPDQPGIGHLAVSSAFELFLLPSPFSRELFLLDGPAWSLFFEGLINVAYALVLVRCSTRTLMLIALGSGGLLIYVAQTKGSLNVGQSWPLFHGGLARVGFSFTLGVIIERLHKATARNSSLALIPMLVLVLLLALPVPSERRVVFDLLSVLIAAPMLVWFSASYNPAPLLHRISEVLGQLSYPIYVVHYPILWIFGYLARKLGVPAPIWIPAFFAVVAAFAWCLNKYWDGPVRSSFGAMLRAPRNAQLKTDARC
jgi:peptidoglycan/LPS O-acetylase OafA/YrhL